MFFILPKSNVVFVTSSMHFIIGLLYIHLYSHTLQLQKQEIKKQKKNEDKGSKRVKSIQPCTTEAQNRNIK